METTAKLTSEQIEKAVNWWASKLARPKFDNGDDSQSGGLAMMMAMMSSMSKPSLNGGVEKFKFALTAMLQGADEWASLDVDYHPEGLLRNALIAAGISSDITSLSWKTHMRFRNGKVFVSEGYGAEEVEL